MMKFAILAMYGTGKNGTREKERQSERDTDEIESN